MRRSGILMHITSLPGPYGIGTMGKNARAFVDFLQQSGQTLWQLLPLTPTGYGDSPYQSCSAFAGNPYLIDPDTLCRQGLLPRKTLQALGCEDDSRVDFATLYRQRWQLLRQAFAAFSPEARYEAFCRENESWLEDYCLFMSLKDHYQGAPWYQWDEAVKHRDRQALEAARERFADGIRFYRFVQYQFFCQWQALREYAHAAGVQIIGDVPIYVPLDSVEVWSQPALFLLDETLTPLAVAGCPPDGFTPDGQLWGNPLYRWALHAADGYRWWRRRMQAAAQWYDIIRIDHFRGFESYWAVPYGDPTARNGRWEQGPGMDFISALKAALPQTPMIAEDLGYLTPAVVALKEASGYPGMKVLLFAFDSREPSDYLPHRYEKNSVCYTGTHDNVTAHQWYDEAPRQAREYADRYLNRQPGQRFSESLIRAAMASVADTCIVAFQDYLDLGAQARMNHPGTFGSHNWTWRAPAGCFSRTLAKKIRSMTMLYGRNEEIDSESCLR